MADTLDETPPVPVAMDNFEELRGYLWKIHGITIAEDDPILVVFTMLRVALDQHELSNDRYLKELDEAVQASATKFTEDVSNAIAEFKEEAIGDVVRERIAAMNEAARQADRATAQFRKLLLYLSVLTATCLLSTIFTIGVLFTVSR